MAYSTLDSRVLFTLLSSCLFSFEFLTVVGVSCYHLDLCSDLCRMSSTLAFSDWKWPQGEITAKHGTGQEMGVCISLRCDRPHNGRVKRLLLGHIIVFPITEYWANLTCKLAWNRFYICRAEEIFEHFILLDYSNGKSAARERAGYKLTEL